jgi:hypothetical protein
MAIGTNTMLDTGTVPVNVASGGTGLATLATYGLMAAGTTATGNMQQVSGTGSSGQVLTSAGVGALPVWANPTSGAYVSIAGTTQLATVNTIYLVANASQTTITLPATAAIGEVVGVDGLGAGGWIITANTGQTVQIGQTNTSVAGTVTSAGNFNSVLLRCIVANTTWSMVSGGPSSGLVCA